MVPSLAVLEQGGARPRPSENRIEAALGHIVALGGVSSARQLLFGAFPQAWEAKEEREQPEEIRPFSCAAPNDVDLNSTPETTRSYNTISASYKNWKAIIGGGNT